MDACTDNKEAHLHYVSGCYKLLDGNNAVFMVHLIVPSGPNLMLAIIKFTKTG